MPTEKSDGDSRLDNLEVMNTTGVQMVSELVLSSL